MPTPAAIRNNPVFQRTQNAQAIQELRAHPKTFLSTTVLTVNAGNGHQTVFSAAVPVVKDTNRDVVRIGAAYNHATAATVPCLVTPTRANQGPAMANRLAPIQQFPIGGAQLWITDQQTGCTFLVLDWGGGQYSAVHILPHLKGDYNRINQLIFGASTNYESMVKNKYLRDDVNTVVSTTSNNLGGPLPQRYIMVQSQYSVGNLRLVQTIGVNKNHQWKFYKQTCRTNHAGSVVESVKKLEWRPWTDWTYRSNDG